MRMLKNIHLKNSNLRQIFLFLGFTIIFFLLVSVFFPSRALAAPAGCWPPASCCNAECTSCCSSFLPGTDITVDKNGTTVDIEKLKVGDPILSFTENSQQTKVNKLVAIRKSMRDYYFIVTAKELTSKKEFNVKASANHPFYVGNNYQSWDPVVPRDYKRTDELEIGNKVYVLNNSQLLEAIISKIERVDRPTEVYSLTVANESNYFAEKFAVHNKFCSPDFCGWNPPNCYESDCNGTNCDTRGNCAEASTCWADSPCYCSPVDNSQCPANRCSNPDGAEGDWRYDCTTNNCTPDVADACVGRPQQCRSGTWVTTNPSGECTTECTNCSHSTPPPPTPPPPTPPPGGSCDNSCGTCGYRLAGGSCSTDNACCHRVCSGSSCITIYGSGSNACDNDAQCVGPSPSPSPSPPPGCSTSVTMSASPNPVLRGSNITFSYAGDGQSSFCVADTLTGGVGVGVPDGRPCNQFDIEYPMSRICTTTAAGTFNWTHYWKINYGPGCTGGTQCFKSWLFSITAPISPWIQVTGDVHSNVRINAPGGP